MNYTDKQIKLAGFIQPEGGAREFEQALDFQGEGIRILGNGGGDFEENVGDCCEDLLTCELALSSCDAEKTALEAENKDLIEENQELTDLANGVPGSCASLTNNPNGVVTPWYWSGVVCVSGESGNLTATLNATFVSWPDPGGPGAGSTGTTGRWIDATYTTGASVFSLTYSYRWEKNEGQTTAFSDTDTSTLTIPGGTIGIQWTGYAGAVLGYTYF